MSENNLRPTRSLRPRTRPRSNSPYGDEDVPVNFFQMDFNDNIDSRNSSRKKTAFVYDDRMLLHKNIWDEEYLENPDRLKACFEKISELKLLDSCIRIDPKEAEINDLKLFHNESYINMIDQTVTMSENELLEKSSENDGAYYNNDTKLSSYLAAGSVLEVVKSVLDGRAKNGFCLVRPPGHHALPDESVGFCIFNNVGLAAKFALNQDSVQRIVIIDWDVHHGQATQYQFYDSNKVLYISIHRYDNGEYWPNLRESDYDFIGTGEGKGFNINIPINEEGANSNDFLAVFHNIILPIIYEYNPHLILVSAGFDAALGDPIGHFNVEPACFAIITRYLLDCAKGRVVMVLEGGYNLISLTESVALCLGVLIGYSPPKIAQTDPPKPSTIESIRNCIKFLHYYWKSLSINVIKSQDKYPEYLSSLSMNSWIIKRHPGAPINDEPRRLKFDEQTTANLHRLLSTCGLIQFENRTCYVYDCRMENHMNEISFHPETPRRTQMIFEFLQEKHILNRCKYLDSRHATKDELKLIHDENYINDLEYKCQQNAEEYRTYEQIFNSIYICSHTYSCALLSAGSLLNVVDEVCAGRSLNGFAIIRPPGHHAESTCAMGFCFFNNVAIAAKYVLDKYPDNYKKILILDWDVHHGNGTQHQFYDDANVLYISLHRYDNGNFFPSSDDGDSDKVGGQSAMGFNINVAWNKKPVRDAEYMGAFVNLIMPVAQEFNPDLILVSAGFDAARGDPLGGLAVTPECYAHMTSMLTCLANGRVVLALEGGYNINVISECMAQCASSLLGDPTTPLIYFPINKHGLEAIRSTIQHHKPYWKCLSFKDSLDIYVEISKHQTNPTLPFVPNEQHMESNTLAHSLGQLAVVEVAYQTEQSIEESLTQQPMDMVLPDHLLMEERITSASNEHQEHLNNEIFTMSPPEDATNTLSTSVLDAAVHPTPQRDTTQQPIDNNDQSFPANIQPQELIDHHNEYLTEIVSSSTADGASGANPSAPINTNRLITHGGSIGLSVQDLMNLSGVQPNEIQEFLGLTSSDPLPDHVFAVNPLSWCEHLSQVHNSPNANEIDVHASCSMCPSTQENWLCLTCYEVFCGRYVRGHMLHHFRATRHSIVLSFADLSSWCYECDSYIHNERLNTAKREAHIAKFGVAQPESSSGR